MDSARTGSAAAVAAMDIERIWNKWPGKDAFSGVFAVTCQDGVLFERVSGFRNRGEKLPNRSDTSFGIASGTKLFTGIAACRLLDEGHLSLADEVWDLLPYDLGRIDKRVTVFHLLTHTSGVGDYIDEEASNSTAQLLALYDQHPVHLWENLQYYLPLITPLPPKFDPGARFGYSNAGFVLLGLVIEAVAGVSYQQYVEDKVIAPSSLRHTGFYRTDSLPKNAAVGYTHDEKSGKWRTNVFKVPVRGGSDGGLYTCAGDLNSLWRVLMSEKLLSKEALQTFLEPQVKRNEFGSYGLGVYRQDRRNKTVFYAVGGDFGVDFFTSYFPRQGIVASALGNTEVDTSPLLGGLISEICG